MKAELFTPVTYYGDHRGALTSPSACDPKRAIESYENAFRECEFAFECGFDSLNVAEHHYMPPRMVPEPTIFAAALGQRLPDATISVLGPLLTINNPVRVAETYAMLDNLLGGRLGAVALLRGVFNEYLTYGTNPWDSREAFNEAVLLVKRAWTEPEPFGWEGRYHRYRQIAIWPRVVQNPHPRIVLSGNSESSARFAGANGCDLGFSYQPPEVAARHVATYRETAAEAGWEPTPDNILFRQLCYVAETDEEAHKDAAKYGWPGESKFLASVGPVMLNTMRQVGAAMAGVPKGVTPDPNKAPFELAPPWIGGPETVLEQIRTFREQAAIGRVEFLIASGRLPHDLVCRSIKLIGEAIIPALHAETGEGDAR